MCVDRASNRMLAACIHTGELTTDVYQNSLRGRATGRRGRCIGSACTPAAPAVQGGTPASAEPIKIGYVWGVTGAVADIVRPASEATHAYFDDLNQHGGIHGHPVEMVEIDSQYQVPARPGGLQEGHRRGHVPLVVLASTGDTEALAPQINADKVVAMTLLVRREMVEARHEPVRLHHVHDLPGPDAFRAEVRQRPSR